MASSEPTACLLGLCGYTFLGVSGVLSFLPLDSREPRSSPPSVHQLPVHQLVKSSCGLLFADLLFCSGLRTPRDWPLLWPEGGGLRLS